MPYNPRRYDLEYSKYQGTDTQKKNRAKRNNARRGAIASGSASKGDGKDVDHKKPLSKGGSNGKSNQRVVKASSNRSFARNSKGGIK